ncbi:putative DNA ligase 1 [Besnoitia besnoiti]|uniref:DNA ligase n=1 Tax=Besnoitia besnoiti TaxID=94643 RepID=A0A2A9LZJ3_BESBE|nr:putative DNA ligase 1 [Besnoitia besnoiti]PFH31808.1 putative DNA ligase 1 [Besnoitia besnoiti]
MKLSGGGSGHAMKQTSILSFLGKGGAAAPAPSPALQAAPKQPEAGTASPQLDPAEVSCKKRLLAAPASADVQRKREKKSPLTAEDEKTETSREDATRAATDAAEPADACTEEKSGNAEAPGKAESEANGEAQTESAAKAAAPRGGRLRKPAGDDGEEDSISEAESEHESIESDASEPSSQEGGNVAKVAASSAEGRRALEMLQKKKRSPSAGGKARAETLVSDSEGEGSSSASEESDAEAETRKRSKRPGASVLDLLCKEGRTAKLRPSPSEEAAPSEKKTGTRKKKSDEDEQLKTGTLFATRALGKEPSADLASPLFAPFQVPLESITAKPEANAKKAQDDTPAILFEVLVGAFDKIEQMKASGTGSSKKQTVILTNAFRLLLFYAPKLLHKAIYICLNKVAPDYLGQEVGVGESLILKAMAETYGRTEAHLKKELQHTEDLGRIAEQSSCKTRTLFSPPRLTIDGVFTQLKAISLCAGKDSQLHKRHLLKRLLVGAKGAEPKYIIRFLQQRMRTGASTATVYQALAFASFLTHNARDGRAAVADTRRAEGEAAAAMSAVELEEHLSRTEQSVRRALCEVPNVEVVVSHLLAGATADTLGSLCVVTPGVPLQPMLARPTRGFAEVAERLKDTAFTCEFKYDGERVQIHLMGEAAAAATAPPAAAPGRVSPARVRLFSRNLEEITQKYPDIIEMILGAFKPATRECILDAEVVAFDVEKGAILPFQTLTRRKRKDVSKDGIQVRVALFLFDCMRLNGECLLGQTLEARRAKLREAVDLHASPLVQQATYKDLDSSQDFEDFLNEAIEGNCEGLMVKTLRDNATYEPSKRSLNWLKVKKDYVEGMTDSVDLVPIGAFYGKGKRSGTFGTYLLAVFNPKDETFQTVCKAATGFTEEALQNQHKTLSDHIISHKKPYYDVTSKMEADVWFEACQVWECRAADLSISPVHTAGMGEAASDKGIGLRFPRFLRVRDDKNPEQATTSTQIIDMYLNQFRQNKTGNAKPKPERVEDEEESDEEMEKKEEDEES